MISAQQLEPSPPTGSPLVVGDRMHALIEELFPICRSITGDGLRATLRRVQREIPLQIHEVPSGTPVFDWTVPKEWNVRDAYIRNSRGEKVVDFRRSNLHLVSYSVPVHRRMTLEELRPHLHSLPDQPHWIPYRTTYYRESWGFCLPHRLLEQLPEGDYEVCIDSTLEPGSLSYGELRIPGESAHEVLISAHVCHPSLANDNLSGVAVAVELAKRLLQERRRYSYRFLFAPATIGTIAWLARNAEAAQRIRHGLVLACVGDSGRTTYKRSRRGTARIDRAVEHVLRHFGNDFEVLDFVPYGYDERQFCSPGFDLAIGSLMRSRNGQYPEYHTSADSPELVQPGALADTLDKCLCTLEVLERDRTYLNLNPHCEPQLGRRGLYQGVGNGTDLPQYELALLWVLNLSDGFHSLLDIAERANMPFRTILTAAERLHQADLLRDVTPGEPTPLPSPASILVDTPAAPMPRGGAGPRSGAADSLLEEQR